MEIVVTRKDERRHATAVERDDGVRLSVLAFGFMHSLPHDLGHYVVEDSLGLESGFWGSVAEGALFRGIAVTGGRQKPHAAKRGVEIAKRNADALNRAEVLVGSFEALSQGARDRDAQIAAARMEAAEITKVCVAWRAMKSRWDALPVGDSIQLAWAPKRRKR